MAMKLKSGVRRTLFGTLSAMVLCAVTTAVAATERQEIELPAQSLQDSLESIGRAYGVTVVAPSSLIAGSDAAAVAGVLTAEEALRAALDNTGLVIEFSPSGDFVLRRAPTARRVERELNPVEVDEDVEEIVVFGTKLGLTLQEETVSAEIYTANRIERESLFTLNEIILRTPNVSSVDTPNFMTIRGIGRRGTGTAGVGLTSNVYVNGAPGSEAALQSGLDTLWDIRQVEVLRGPQSTIQGRNALAGGIFITTNDPTYAWEGRARVRIAEFDNRQYAGVVSGPIVDEQAAFRLAANYETREGEVTNVVTGDDVGGGDSLQLQGKLLLEPEAWDALSAQFTLSYSENELRRVRSQVRAPVPATDPDFADFDFHARRSFITPTSDDSEILRSIADISYALNDNMGFRFIGTYESADVEILLGDLDDLSRFDVNQVIVNNTDIYSTEARLEYAFGRVSGLFGAYYFDSDVNAVARGAGLIASTTPFPIDPVDSVLSFEQENSTDTENYSFFASMRFEPTAKWTFDLGVRYDNEEASTQSTGLQNVVVTPETCLITVPGFLVGAPLPFVQVPCLDLIAASIPPPNPIRSGGFDVFLPRGAVTYHFSNAFSVFVGAQRGYRAGGTFLQATSTGINVGAYDPEFLNNYEAGWRSQWLDRRLTFNGNVFYGAYEDQQVRVPGPSGSFADAEIINAAKSTIYGLEITADYQVSAALSVFASLGLLETEFDDFPFAAPGAPFDNLAGNELENSPDVTFSLGAGYEHPGGLFGDASVSYTGSSESDLFNLGPEELGPGLTERVDGYALVNLRIGYRNDRFSITGYATNLLDEDSPRSINIANLDSVNGAVNYSNTPSQVLTMPRTFGVILEANF